ncbi:threonine aldolase family protein [Thalassorhabdomicrobium marinisediminis]|uniref:Low specificity L-threonine aldolase n=1 Tax=Thalassorhabdomicrobium marinisediminis TaxID=2170577 RepID=A0A2T7FUL1_9RHOB|nr:beta-eliminating lyase-related protein [Thalassorhabdomicrobium marinisediminis]PVA05848.1 low specificity L-threonine aldolase [Thalassorhabdomicrobium marinisediminis]
MFFASDNSGPAHPSVLDALHRANEGYRFGYGADAEMDRVRQMVRDLFEAPEAAVYLVATGTAANSIALATLAQPWETIFCTKPSHINEDECNAPEFYSGAKLTLVDDVNAKMTAETLRAAMEAEETRGVHGPQRGPVSITQVTEKGTVYTLDEIAAVTKVARDFGVSTHLDGARFANAIVTLGCTPAEMTWKAGIDCVSFGGTKNGLMGVEAVIFFDPKHAWEFELRRKRGAHLFSKHRYLSAQMEAYLTDDLWRDLAARANAAAQRLAEGLRATGQVTFTHEPEANLMFFSAPRHLHRKLQGAGAQYYVMDSLDGDADAPVVGRLVCDWSIGAEGVDAFLDVLKR